MAVVHALVAVFLVAEVSEDLANPLHRDVVHKWGGVTYGVNRLYGGMRISLQNISLIFDF